MMTLFSYIGTASLLLLVTTLLPTDADYVTLAKCSRYGRQERVREYPIDTEASWLNVAMCRLKNITHDDIDGLPNVVVTFMNYNDLINVDTVAFRSLPNLTKLEIGFNQLSEAPVFVENSCPSLTELFLWNNQIKTIDKPDTFSACSKLQRLFLSNNQIEHLHSDLFKNLPNLKELYLYDNKISFIPEQMFIGSPVERLELQYNKLSYLPANFISNLPNLNLFGISYNPFECVCLHELLSELRTVSRNTTRVGFKYHSDGTDKECVPEPAETCHRAKPRSRVTARLG